MVVFISTLAYSVYPYIYTALTRIYYSEAAEAAARGVAQHNGLPLLLGALQYFLEWDTTEAAEAEGGADTMADGAAASGSDEEEEDISDDEAVEEEGGGKQGKKGKKTETTGGAEGAGQGAEAAAPPATMAELRDEAVTASCHALRAAVEGGGYPLVEQLVSVAAARGGGGGGGGGAPLVVLVGLLGREDGGVAAGALPPLARVHLAGCVAAVYLELKRVGFTDSKVCCVWFCDRCVVYNIMGM